MIGFPLSLPIDATAERNFYLAEIKAETLPADGLSYDHDHFFQFKIDVTESEAKALRAWLQKRGQNGANPDEASE